MRTEIVEEPTDRCVDLAAGNATENVAAVFTDIGLRMTVAQHHSHDRGDANAFALGQSQDVQRVGQDGIAWLRTGGQQALPAHAERKPAGRQDLQGSRWIAGGDRNDVPSRLLVVAVHQPVNDGFAQRPHGDRAHRPALHTDDLLARRERLQQQLPRRVECRQQRCRRPMAPLRGNPFRQRDQDIKLVDARIELAEQQRTGVVENRVLGVVDRDAQPPDKCQIGPRRFVAGLLVVRAGNIESRRDSSREPEGRWTSRPVVVAPAFEELTGTIAAQLHALITKSGPQLAGDAHLFERW